ncbi:MAG: xylose isomerase [Planctomycetes bacterium RBG_13_60_9]|nr:MAG: xylose isomerase [Planctomycetes bacterium RBG_13_60_9]
MTNRTSSRREFLGGTVLATGLAAAVPGVMGAVARAGASGANGKLHVACNQYPWGTFYARQKKDFNASLDAGLAEVKASGIDGFEPGVGGLQQIEQMVPVLKKHGLEMRSLYVNSTLHEADQADKSIEEVLAAAVKAKAAGTQIIVTNPSPIRWGGPENKTDEQLKTQAAAMNKLGVKLKQMGLTLAYHNHDIELRNAAREFHHMMVGTDPAHVTLCLDAHWIYRGAGNSQVALFDVLKLYGPRVTELHLRQSQNGVWTEAFGPGDIDYERLAGYLLKTGVKPLLVLEQAVEAGSANTMNAVEAFKKSTQYTRQLFAGFAS